MKTGIAAERISTGQYDQVIAEAQLLVSDRHGPKVLKRNDGRFIKIFRRKHQWSSAMFRPYAVRFVRNTTELNRRGVPSVKADAMLHCPDLERHLVTYEPLAGTPLREALSLHPNPTLLDAFARFLADLHAKGVYFRSIHFGNVLLLPDGAFGLIDCADLQFSARPLRAAKRAANFKHFLRYDQDVRHLRAFGVVRFLQVYLQAAALTGWRQTLFLHNVRRVLNRAGLPGLAKPRLQNP